jgi:predicted metal-dependent peptidase
LWNIADDYCVNYDLVEQKVGDKIPVALYDAKFKGMAAEEVYDYLYQNANKIDINQLAKQLLDEHLDGDSDSGDGDEDGDGQQRSHAGGKPGDKDGQGRPKVSKEEQKEIRDELREAILAAANAVGAGNLPGGVKRMIKDLTEPVMNWRELLEQQIQSTIKSDYTWSKPSRRSWHMDAVMPGMKPGQQIDVCVAIDTSGSITEKDLKDFLSEVKGIMEAYDEYKIHIITWDTAVHNPQVFTSENLEEIETYVPGGGGGTEPHCVWEWMQENEIEPKKLIMFTDFCFFGWNPAEVQDYCDTVWIIKGNRNAEPEFGLYAHYEDEKAGK